MFFKNILIFVLSFLIIGNKAQVLKLQEFYNNKSKLYTLTDFDARRTFTSPSEDAYLSAPELVSKYGYPIEVHTIETEDNYLLTVHRIPYGKKNDTKENRKPIFLMHGILSSSADWILMGPEKSISFLLADMGYDVWIGNARGNIYSRSHKFWDPNWNADNFWDFSWHEIGMYDLPAMIDYILEKTNNEKLYYIGHSQGGTTFFVMTSMRPEYNKKIAVMFGLAPAVFMRHAKSPLLKYTAKFLPASQLLLNILGRNEFALGNNQMKDLIAKLCDEQSTIQGICKNILFLLAGFDEAQLDEERLPVMLSNSPAGCSTKQVVHFLQNTNSRENLFNFFDHGPTKNMALYSSSIPPEYPLNKVTAHVALISGYNDLFVDILDVDKLATKLSNVFLNTRVPYERFTHLDFLWAKDVVPLVYNTIFEQLKHF